ncbi:MAG: C40 family peptidase [Candidatus Moranbacteria bacterium]|nr:C40 family peptidase [Candidatus Moranbacteria bacterium]
MKNANCAYCNAQNEQHNPPGCQLNSCKGNPAYTDCSNFVSTAYTQSGCSSPGSTTADMYPKAEEIGDKSSLKAGDAIVYRYENNTRGHVVICEDDGCSKVIAAKGVKTGIQEENSSGYLNKSGAKVLRASKYCGNC